MTASASSSSRTVVASGAAMTIADAAVAERGAREHLRVALAARELGGRGERGSRRFAPARAVMGVAERQQELAALGVRRSRPATASAAS